MLKLKYSNEEKCLYHNQLVSIMTVTPGHLFIHIYFPIDHLRIQERAICVAL